MSAIESQIDLSAIEDKINSYSDWKDEDKQKIITDFKSVSLLYGTSFLC